MKTIKEYLLEEEIDFAESIKKDISDSVKTGKNFIKLFRTLRLGADVSEYVDTFNKIIHLEIELDKGLHFGKDKCLADFKRFVDTEPLVIGLVVEVLSNLNKSKKKSIVEMLEDMKNAKED